MGAYSQEREREGKGHQNPRRVWRLPDENEFRYTGPDWLLVLLANASRDAQPLILLVLWRAWHLRNNIIHEDGKCTIDASFVFLQNYADILYGMSAADHIKGKGKQVASVVQVYVPKEKPKRQVWKPPELGCLKMNVDASFITESNEGFVGMVIRDHRGNVQVSSTSKLKVCRDVEEAEANALLHGLRLCADLGVYPAVVETDCVAVCLAAVRAEENISTRCAVYRDIARVRNLLPDFVLSQVNRDCNSVAHDLAKLCRAQGTVGIWFNCLPSQISPDTLIMCNPLYE